MTAQQDTSGAPDAGQARGERSLLAQITQSSVTVVVLAVAAALLIGGLLAVAAHKDVHAAAPHIFSNPGEFFRAVFSTLGSMYSSIFSGAVWNGSGSSFTAQLRP